MKFVGTDMQYRVQEPSDMRCSFLESFVNEALHGPTEWSSWLLCNKKCKSSKRQYVHIMADFFA